MIVSEDNDEMLWADLAAEDETVDNYRERILQAQALGEYALAEILQEIIKEEQDHQIELASALGVVPDPRERVGEGPSLQSAGERQWRQSPQPPDAGSEGRYRARSVAPGIT